MPCTLLLSRFIKNTDSVVTPGHTGFNRHVTSDEDFIPHQVFRVKGIRSCLLTREVKLRLGDGLALVEGGWKVHPIFQGKYGHFLLSRKKETGNLHLFERVNMYPSQYKNEC